MVSTSFSVLCLSLGVVLTYASLAKLKSFQSFCDALGDFLNFSSSMVRVLSVAVISAEFAIGVSLILGVAIAASLWFCLVLMVVMVFVSRIKSKSTPDALCLCFGQDGVLANSWKSWARSVLLLAGNCGGLVMVYGFSTSNLEALSLKTVALTLVIVLLLAWITDIPFHYK